MHNNDRRKAVNMAGRRVDILPTRSMPAWMKSPGGMFTAGWRRSVNATNSVPVNGLSSHGLLQHENKAAAKGASKGRLFVRGGGAAVGAGGPLGGVLFATALLSAVLERWTKAGAVVGAPLLSFATFCVLRCHSKY